MRGDVALPWQPRVQLRGRTEFTFSQETGRVYSYDETWVRDVGWCESSSSRGFSAAGWCHAFLAGHLRLGGCAAVGQASAASRGLRPSPHPCA
eukprot:scaffold4409_cov369-Prasinococcus_capsulatus_cf.AAC.13